MKKIIFLLITINIITNVSYASFPITSENIVIQDGVNFVNTTNIDPFNTLGWIALSCIALGGVLMALQLILAPGAYIGGYIIIGMVVGGVGSLLGLIWIFSRFKWGRKYWWVLLLGLFLIQIISEQSSMPIIHE